MKKILNMIFILLLLSSILVFSKSAAGERLTLKGIVVDKNGKRIKYARVVVTPMPDPQKNTGRQSKNDKNSLKKRYVTYANKSGSWQIDIPRERTILIKVFANTYKTAQKILYFDQNEIEDRELSFWLDDGLADIIWGSFEHVQLYVAPVHQEKLETLITSNKISDVADYIDTKIKNTLKNKVHAFAGYILFQNSRFPESKIHFEKAGSRLWHNLMGNLFKKEGRFQQALSHFLNGPTTKDRADSLLFLAKKFAEQADPQNEKTCYQTALTDYQQLLRSLKYHWNEENIEKSNLCIEQLKSKFGYSEKKTSVKREISDILKKAGDYCKKLDDIAIYYFCHELKKDKVVLIRKLARAMEYPAEFFENYSPLKTSGTRITDVYKYDIQFIKKKNGIIEENRKLLVENLDNSNPGIPVLSYSIKEPLYGPHTLIALGWQSLFDYRLLGEENMFGEDTVILEATPRWNSVFNKMSGKIWLNKNDGSVHKIEWYYSRVQNRRQLRTMGLILDREPDLKFVSEFGLEKNRLRFPSRCYIIDSYTDSNGERFERLKVDIEYMNYQFFIVSSEVEVHDEY